MSSESSTIQPIDKRTRVIEAFERWWWEQTPEIDLYQLSPTEIRQFINQNDAKYSVMLRDALVKQGLQP